MNHIHFFTNFIPQSFIQLMHLIQAQNPVLLTARNESVSTVALARIADANIFPSAPPVNARSPSPAPCSSDAQVPIERFIEELHLWCEEKCGGEEYQNRIEAKEKMIECFITSCVTLDLSRLNLTSLPSAIGLLSDLKLFDLTGNQLTSLPSTIGLLTDLQYLDLTGNQLTSLPSTIGSLKNLKDLCLSSNQFTSLPDFICLLTGLQKLYLSCNRFTSLPPEIGLLSCLRMLVLSNNQLTTLPATIGLLTSLDSLYLSYNQITSLPVSIESLRDLQLLDVINNPLSSLPDSILNLDHGCVVELSNTALSIRVLMHLREETTRALYHGPQFCYSMPALRVPQEQSITRMISELYRIIGQPEKEFPNLEASDQGQHLRSWLNRLFCTATYKRGGDAQRRFVSQIVRYLVAAEESETFRSILMPILQDASETCGDRVALSILHIGVGHRLHHFDLSDPKGLSQFLIRGPMTLSILEQYARELIPTFLFVDEIEVYLGLPVMLKDRLNIPIDVSEMLYFRCSNLTDSHLAIAADRVSAEIDDLNARYQFLIEQPKWLEALEMHFPSEMVNIREEYLQMSESAPDPFSARLRYEEHLKALTERLLK